MRRDDVPEEGPGYSPEGNGEWGCVIIIGGLVFTILMLLWLAGLAAGNGNFY